MAFPLRLVKMLFRYLSSLTFLLVPFLLLGEEREAWTSSKISGSPELPPPYVAEAVWPHITFNQGLDITLLESEGLIFVTERFGKFLAVAIGFEKPAKIGVPFCGHERTYSQSESAAGFGVSP